MGTSASAQGVMVTKCGLGVLGDKIDRPTTKIVPIHDGFAHFTDDIKFPLTPMIGVMGVSPAEGRIHCAIPADNGGNMDTKLVKVGSKIYFPVFQDGAGLAVGDMHACMGDGELDGTGIETAGRMCLKVTVYKDRPVEDVFTIDPPELLHYDKSVSGTVVTYSVYIPQPRTVSTDDLAKVAMAEYEGTTADELANIYASYCENNIKNFFDVPETIRPVVNVVIDSDGFMVNEDGTVSLKPINLESEEQ